ncbi:MAG: ribosome assembly RNA-binding protein YhbY [Halioglobus sp.]|nr:ribosome assembly RNA-binding protein YhbY [Halioglobus sp.]|tara:strand:+ start:1428 stop:1739 length:312 start_codon:yes stop_codon:yes gene_type:complete
MSNKTSTDTRQLRAIGHKLKPVVTVAGNGLSDSVLAEIDAALSRHELIKVKLAVGDRALKAAVAGELCARTGAEAIQSIGNMLLILRRAETPDPRLSNLIRPL